MIFCHIGEKQDLCFTSVSYRITHADIRNEKTRYLKILEPFQNKGDKSDKSDGEDLYSNRKKLLQVLTELGRMNIVQTLQKIKNTTKLRKKYW